MQSRLGLFTLAILSSFGTAFAQGLPAGPKVVVTAVTQVSPSIPQWTRVDVPLLREEVPKKSGGRIEVKLLTWPEASVSGPEVIRHVRSGQADIGAAPLTTVSGDVPMLDGFDLSGLNPEIGQAKRVAAAMITNGKGRLKA